MGSVQFGGVPVDSDEIVCLLNDLADLHIQFERAADPDAAEVAGGREAAELSAKVGSLLSACGRPTALG